MLFDHLKLLPPDPILGLAPLFNSDQRSEKVNLGIGTYMNETGKPIVFEVVRQAEKKIDQAHLNKEYQPIDGSSDFKDAIFELVFGDKAEKIKDRTAVIASIGGSGSIRLAGDLLNLSGVHTIAMPNPTWSNHKGLLKNIPHHVSYPYYDVQNHMIDFPAILSALENLPQNSFVLFHTCCQNPSGADLTLEQWKSLIPVMKKHALFPLFDFAYHGFKEGIEEDRLPIHLFLESGFEFLICYSLSKSMTLYGERVGALIAVCHSNEAKEKVISQVRVIIRHNYSSPPLHGTRIVHNVVLNSKESWEKELSQVRERVKSMRALFAKKMGSRFDYVTAQNGLFSLLGLNQDMVMHLRDRYGIYMPENGRINFAGLNESNIDYAVKSLSQALQRNSS